MTKTPGIIHPTTTQRIALLNASLTGAVSVARTSDLAQVSFQINTSTSVR